MNPYGPVAIYLCVALAAALLFSFLPGLLGRSKPNPQKQEAYECGVEPTSAVAGRFPVRFYFIESYRIRRAEFVTTRIVLKL